MSNPLFNRSLRNDKDGFGRYSSWFYGGLARNCGFTDGDGILHDGGDGRNRLLFVEDKPTTDPVQVGQKILLQGIDKMNEAITVVVVCMPVVNSRESVGKPHFVADPRSAVHYTVVDHQMTSWDTRFVQTTLWEWNRMIRHWHKGNDFGPVPKECTCCKWGETELNTVLSKVTHVPTIAAV